MSLSKASRRGDNPTMRSTLLSLLLVGATAALCTVSASRAEAQPRGSITRNGIDGVRFEVHGVVGWYHAFGAGMRVEIPLLKDGFTNKLDDEFALSFGGDVGFFPWGGSRYDGREWDRRYGNWGRWYGDWAFWGVVTANYNIYVGDKWSFFPELGFTISVHDCWDQDFDRDVCVTAAPVAGVGARYHFGRRAALVLRVNWPIGLQVGLAF